MIYHYIQSFLRSVKKNQFFYSINLIGFFVGFLILTVITAFVYQEFSFDRFHENSSNIYRINSGGYGVTPLCFKEKLDGKLAEISHVVQLSSTSLEINYNEQILNIGKTYYTDSELFDVFSFKLLSGNPNHVLQAPFSIVLDKSTASELFGEQSPLGKIIHGKHGDYTVTGIMEDIPYNSHIQSKAFISFETLRQVEGENAFNCGSWFSLTYVSLLKNSIVKDTETEINTILKDSRMANNPLKLESLKKVYFDYNNNKYDGCKHGNIQTTFLYLGIAIFILIIVVFNYINLSTTILISRLKEFSIRKINGAKRKDIIKHVMIETVGVAFVSLIIALVVVEFLLHPLSNILNIPISSAFKRTSLYTYFFAGIGITSFIIGLIPGIFISKVNEIKVLKNESIFGSRNMQRKLLLVFELIIVAILLNSLLLVKKQIDFMLQKDMGLQYENVIAFNVDQILQDKSELLKGKLLAAPSIEKVSFSNSLIGEGFTKVPIDVTDDKELCYTYFIDSEYILLYNIDIKYGRNFSFDLITDGNSSCIINEEACKSIGMENPIDKVVNGKRIVGVVKNFNYSSLHDKIEPLILSCGKGNVLQIRIAQDNQEKTINFIKDVCMSISPDFDFNYAFLDSRIKNLYKSDMNVKSSIEIYSILAFLITLLGLWGLMLFTIKKKTKEVCIRKLHGARMSDTFKLFAKEQVSIVLISNIVSIPISIFIVNKWLNNFAYKVDIGFLIFIKTLFVVAFFTILAISFLIIKSQKANLVETLKYE